MPLLCLVSGAPACGKTTLARRLSQALSWPMAAKDEIKERLFDEVGFASRAEKVRLGQAAGRILLYFGARQLACGQSCILESNFSHADRPALEALAARWAAPLLTVRLRCQPDVLYRRFVARDQDASRHRGHVVNDRFPAPPGPRPYAPPMDEAEFHRRMAASGILDFGLGRVIPVDTTDFATLDFAALAAQIKEESATG